MPANSTDSLHVVHQPERQRFVILDQGDSADEPVLEYRMTNGRIAFTHTYVPEALEGHGLAAALATAGLEYARAQGLRVLPYCPYMATFVRRRATEWGDLVDEIGAAE